MFRCFDVAGLHVDYETENCAPVSTPEQRLLAAVLHRALSDLDVPDTHIVRDAVHWFTSNIDEAPGPVGFTYTEILRALEVSEHGVKLIGEVVKTVEGKLYGQRVSEGQEGRKRLGKLSEGSGVSFCPSNRPKLWEAY